MNLSDLMAGQPMVGEPVQRSTTQKVFKMFLIWTAVWWGGVGVMALLFL